MQISKINIYNNSKPYNNITSYRPIQNPQHTENSSAQNLNFEGFSLKNKGLYGKYFLSKVNNKDIYFFFNDLSLFINAEKQQVQKYAKLNKRDKMDFFYDMARKMYLDVYKNKIPLPENRLEVLDDLYNSVTQPNSFHFRILKNEAYTFNDSARLIKLAAQDKTNHSLISKLQNIENINRNNSFIDLGAENIINIVQSPEAAKLNKNFEDYKAFISVNYQKPDFVETLLKELSQETPSFNTEDLNTQLLVKDVKQRMPVLSKLPDETISNNWNEKGFELFDDNTIPFQYFVKNDSYIEKKDIPFYEYLIKTTTKDNLETRKLLFQEFKGVSNEGNTPEAIIECFNRIDTDKNFKELFEIAADTPVAKKPVTELMFYVDKFGSEVLAQNSERFINLLKANVDNITSPDDVVEILSKNLNNKYYLSRNKKYNMMENESLTRQKHIFTGDMRAKYLRAKRKFKYDFMPKFFGTGKPVPVKTEIDYKTYHNNIAKISPARTASIEQPKLKIKQEYKAKKLQIQQEAQEILKSRMKSAKQIQEQIGDYSKKATKMRNQFLNEMFNSVAETRAQQRAQGIKRPTISNADVLEVYEKINGKNKKLFKYLLNSRKENGEREFNLKQISKILEEVKRNRPQKINPSEK